MRTKGTSITGCWQWGFPRVRLIFAYLMIGKTRNVKIVCLVVAFVLVLFIVVYVLKIYPRTHPKPRIDDETVEEDIKIYHEKGRNTAE